MANIDLNKIFKNNFKTTSKVDSEIKLNKNNKKQILYSDFKLDLVTENYNNLNINAEKINKDIALITDEESILNSLRNIITTKYHSRLLNPEMNFDLRSYLFEELTEAKAFFIGYDLASYIPVYEPRVQIGDINISAHYNSNTYTIKMTVFIPSINKNVNLRTILNSDGFSFI